MALRQLWSLRTTFLLAAIGSAVGLGNLWRFPFIAYKNGGGAFLVPYFIALLTAGIPLLMAEYAFGARSKTGAPHSMRNISPRVEWAKLLAFFLIIAITLVALFVSTALAMGLFGGIVLIGGLLWLIVLDWLKRHKMLPKSATK